MSKQKNILVAVLGSTPQILTETLWCLKKEKGIDIDEVFVITTQFGKKLICEGNPSIGLPPLLNGVFEKFCKEFGMKIKFTEGNIKVIRDEKGIELEDIRDDRQNEIAADFITNEIRRIVSRKNAILHCSVAGGRKTMSVYASLAMTLVGRKQDKLYHVLVSPPEIEGNPQFFYKPEIPIEIELNSGKKISTDKIEITLAEIPFLRLGEKYLNIFPEKISYTELVERIQNYVNFEKPAISGDRGEAIEIIGENKKFKEALKILEKYAKNDKIKVVLLVGESGTGKELFANYFHRIGSRSDKKYLAINCATIPETLIESELFGHVKGAFTGASKDKKGIFEECHGGVLFLDEINKTNPAFQEKLLRVIEYGEFMRVGGLEMKKVDVRIIIGLNQEPSEWLKSGNVLPDFYNRIVGHQVRIPPLRDRKDDIPILVNHFVNKYSTLYEKNIKGVSDEIMHVFLDDYDWSFGNVRELERVIDAMIARADDNEQILTNLPEYFEFKIKAQEQNIKGIIEEISKGKNLTLAELNREYIKFKLHENGYNVSKTAKDLGLKRSTLQGKMKKLGVEVPKYRR